MNMGKGYTSRYTFEDIWTNSPLMEETKDLAARVAKSHSTVLIQGESGTGKELFAHAIHQLSIRRNKPFVSVNCAAIPEELFESEFFGYEAGAFSGASSRGKPGKFELAHGGTLFLDEISELPYFMQGKLLRVLQEREVERIGGTHVNPVDVRIIAASNRPLQPLVEEKKFRADLYYRLRVFPLYIPSLRERKEDILYLAERFLHRFSQQYGKPAVTMEEEVRHWMMQYPWYGNVRELKNFVEAAVLLVDEQNPILTMRHVRRLMDLDHARPAADGHSPEAMFRPTRWPVSLKQVVESVEKQLISLALEENQGDRMKAAELLSIHYTSLYRKLNKYSLEHDAKGERWKGHSFLR